MDSPTLHYDADGFRRIRPSERSPGHTELRLPNGRTFACAAFGPEADRVLSETARRSAGKTKETNHARR